MMSFSFLFVYDQFTSIQIQDSGRLVGTTYSFSTDLSKGTISPKKVKIYRKKNDDISKPKQVLLLKDIFFKGHDTSVQFGLKFILQEIVNELR